MANLDPVITVIPHGQPAQPATAPEGREAAAASGRPIADVLAEADGDTHRIYLNDRNIQMMRALAGLPGNAHFGEIADRGYFTVDVSSLRSRDPEDRVRIQVTLAPTTEDELQILQP